MKTLLQSELCLFLLLGPILPAAHGRATLAARLVGPNREAPVAARVQVGIDDTHYTANKRPDAECAAWTPTTADVTFKYRRVDHYTLNNVRAPSDIVVTMTNTSGCVVVTRGTITVIGSQGDVYTSDKLPSGSGHGFEQTATPFGWNLGPAGNEYPVSGRFGVIEVCSATPPPNWPPATYFRPFIDGKCSKFTGTEGPWMHQTVEVNGARIQQDISTGVQIDITQNGVASQWGQTYKILEADMNGATPSLQRRGNTWVLLIAMRRRGAKLRVTDASGQASEEVVSRFELFFGTEADARGAMRALTGQQ